MQNATENKNPFVTRRCSNSFSTIKYSIRCLLQDNNNRFFHIPTQMAVTRPIPANLKHCWFASVVPVGRLGNPSSLDWLSDMGLVTQPTNEDLYNTISNFFIRHDDPQSRFISLFVHDEPDYYPQRLISVDDNTDDFLIAHYGADKSTLPRSLRQPVACIPL